jgi:hypothetical protein
MFKIIAIIVVVLLVAQLGFAATEPDTLRVQRSTTIKAPPEKIFALINDFHRWGSLVTLREIGPRDEANPQRRGQRQGRGV